MGWATDHHETRGRGRLHEAYRHQEKLMPPSLKRHELAYMSKNGGEEVKNEESKEHFAIIGWKSLDNLSS